MESTRNDNISKDKVSVDAEVQKLFKRTDGKVSQQDFQNLRNKYNNEELVQQIEQVFIERNTEITKKAKKFAQLIREKYANSQYPFHTLLEKAMKYKVKHHLTDEEFSAFQRIYETELVGLKSPDMVKPTTNVQKVLGNISVDYQGFAKTSAEDYKVLQDILKLHSATKPLHASVKLQSMQYQDCGIEALTGQYNKDMHNVASHVHPVVAALFLPKIPILEEHFLHSNFANIVKTRYNKEPFSTVADYQLFYAMINDPNDIVCDSRSTLMDLNNRALLQNQLWNSVLSLRNGQYYNNSFREFINSIDTCRMNKYDSPDLIYGRHDGTIIKRLLAAFSFAPTVITSMPIYQVYSVNPYQQNLKPSITKVPMINLKLPYSVNDNSPVRLADALEQTQLILENGIVVPKQTSIIYSRGVLFFYVDRRSNVVDTANLSFGLNILPSSISQGLERLNTREVDFDTVFTIKNDQYNLRSVIVSELNQNATRPEDNIVIGSSAMVMLHEEPSLNRYQPEYLSYDPYAVSKSSIAGGVLNTRAPIEQMVGVGLSQSELGFVEKARRYGIIFMYQLVNDTTNNIITY
jgi:hypothetical protein